MGAERERGGNIGALRIYTSNIGQFNVLAVELEYEDLAAYEKQGAVWRARPTTAGFMEKWLKLRKSGGSNEIWNLAG